MKSLQIESKSNQTINSITQSPASQILTPITNISETIDQQSLLDIDSPMSVKTFGSSFQARRKEKLKQLDLSFNSPQLKSSRMNSEVSCLRHQLMGMVGINIEPNTANTISGYVLSKYAQKSNQVSDPKPFSRKFDQIYDIGRKIGEGGNSVVKECSLKSNNANDDIQSKIKYAVKVVKFSDTEQLFNIIEEQRIMSMMKHMNIVELIDFFIDKNKHSVHLVMEYCHGKNITQLLKKKHKFTELNVKYIIRTLLQLMHYIHQKGICHRDLSNNNVIIDITTMKIKLIDFSVSKECRNKLRKMWTKTGTLQFVAPESVQEERDGYDPKIDLWSIGVIMFSLLTSELPFQDPNDNELGTIDRIINCEPDYEKYIESKQISAEAHSLLLQLLQKDPQKRVSARQAIIHPWLEEKMEKVRVIPNNDKIVQVMKSPIFLGSKPKYPIDNIRQGYQNNKQKSLQIKKQPSFLNPSSLENNQKNNNGEGDYAFSPRSKVISIGNPLSLQFHKQNYEAK